MIGQFILNHVDDLLVREDRELGVRDGDDAPVVVVRESEYLRSIPAPPTGSMQHLDDDIAEMRSDLGQ